jgi:hypothetical protein
MTYEEECKQYPIGTIVYHKPQACWGTIIGYSGFDGYPLCIQLIKHHNYSEPFETSARYLTTPLTKKGNKVIYKGVI